MNKVEVVDFYGYPLKVNRYVLTPSVETEQLISKTINNLRDFKNPKIILGFYIIGLPVGLNTGVMI